MSVEKVLNTREALPVVRTSSAAGTGFTDTLQRNISAPSSLENIFEEASRKYGVPSQLIKAVAKAESDFNTRAVSHCGAQGVMQLMPATARSLGVTDSFDPRQNIMGGTKYLSQMLKKYDGNVKLALAAYNAGSGAVDRYNGIPPYKETQNYVTKIMGYLGQGDIKVPSRYNNVPGRANTGGVSSYSGASSYGGSYAADTVLGGQDEAVYRKILESISSYDGFTEDDYLILVQMLRQDMQSSVSKTLSDAGSDADDSVVDVARMRMLFT